MHVRVCVGKLHVYLIDVSNVEAQTNFNDPSTRCSDHFGRGPKGIRSESNPLVNPKTCPPCVVMPINVEMLFR